MLREREIKLAARAPEALEELVGAPAIADFELAPVELREQRDVYLDTEDFLLFTAGYALRQRRCCGLVKAALKQIPGAQGRGLLHDRGEIEEDLGAGGEPKGAVAEALASLAGGAPLFPILRLRTRRRVRKVLASGRPVAELCLDEVEVSPGEESAAPRGRFFEVEVEETAEGSEVLEAIGEALLASRQLEPSLLSKLERGLDILDLVEARGGKPPQALSAATPCFRLAGALGAREIEQWLAERFSTAPGLETLETKTFYDSFDWRIHESGGTFETAESGSGRESVWRDETGRVRQRLCHAGAPGFPKDLPAGAMRDELAAVLCERRLLPLVTLKARVRSVGVLDGEQKTTVRLHIESGASSLPEGGPIHELEPRLRVAPVRGYGAEGAQVAAFLRTECGLIPDAASELERALAPLGRAPGDYTSKFQLELDPATPASEAARAIHRALLDAMLRNEEGTRRDLDSEFLHDFRVAIRRTRSALTQIREVYPEEVALRFREEFRWLGSETGPGRDLAVFLLKIDAYREGLPPEVRPDLDPLREFLDRQQKLAHDRLVAALDSERYHSLVRDWRAFLARAPAGSALARNADRPIQEVASGRVWQVYRRMVKHGRAMDESSPAEAFHDMRIRVKKLRYLLEFFRSLYSERAIGRIVARLKRLQDNLGDLNDCRVQKQSVRRFAAEMAEQGSAPVGTLLAMGRLIERLDAASAAERRRFAKRFKGLASGEREDFARLFSPENEP